MCKVRIFFTLYQKSFFSNFVSAFALKRYSDIAGHQARNKHRVYSCEDLTKKQSGKHLYLLTTCDLKPLCLTSYGFICLQYVDCLAHLLQLMASEDIVSLLAHALFLLRLFIAISKYLLVMQIISDNNVYLRLASKYVLVRLKEFQFHALCVCASECVFNNF